MKKLLVLTAVAMLVLGSIGCRCCDWMCRRGDSCGMGCGAPCGVMEAPGCGPCGAAPCGTCSGGVAPVSPAAEGYVPAPMH
jgi:hypothetical protein